MTYSKHLAIFLPALHGGGAERTMLNLAHGIAVRGCKVDLVVAHAVGPYLKEIPETVRLVDLKAKKTILSPTRLAGYLWREKPDALLSALCWANVTAILSRWIAGTSTRIVISERNTLSRWATQSGSLHSRITLEVARRIYHRADGITTVSHGVADDLMQLVHRDMKQIHVIYNPVVTQILQEKMNGVVDHRWFDDGAPPVIVGVGSLSRQKDFGTLIQAFAKVQRQQKARLLILGEGEERPQLEQLIETLGIGTDVSLPGWVDNPYPYMKRAGLFVLSSRWEGLPSVLIEALYSGVPLVSTDCPSGPQEILSGGKYGRLVPVGDVDAMANAIGEMLTNRAYSRPEESWHPYEMEYVVDQYIDVLFGTGQPSTVNNPTANGGRLVSQPSLMNASHSFPRS